MFSFSGLFQMLAYIFHNHYIVYYNFIGILLTSIPLFELIRRIKACKKEFLNHVITYISKISLGIFFVHRPILFIFKFYWKLNFLPCLNVLIYYVTAMAISIFIIYLLSKINFIKKHIFLIK